MLTRPRLIIVLCTLLAGVAVFVYMQWPNERTATLPAQNVSSTLPTPIATQVLPGWMPSPVPSNQPGSTIPVPVETAHALATERAIAPTGQAAQIAARKATATALAIPVLEKDYGSWRFKGFRYPTTIDYRPGWEVVVNIWYDDATIEGLKAYANASQNLTRRLAAKGGETEVYITFRNYLTPEQFSAWASTMGLRLKNTELRVIYEEDSEHKPPTRTTRDAEFGPSRVLGIESAPDDTVASFRARVDDALAKQQKYYLQMGYKLHELKGVYFTSAIVEAKYLPKVADDPLVFLTDVTFEVVREELRAAEVEDVDRVRILFNTASGGGWHNRVFPQMEVFGLDKFAR